MHAGAGTQGPLALDERAPLTEIDDAHAAARTERRVDACRGEADACVDAAIDYLLIHA
jgi:hypothetical protein